MALNTLVYGSVLQKRLDAAAAKTLTSGWMDANAGQVEYNGGNRIKMPKISTTGLKDYDRDDGYPSGGVTLAYKEYEMTMDRGASFQLDRMDVNETNFIVNATKVRGLIVFEIDRYVQGLENPRVERTMYGVTTSARADVEPSPNPYAGVLNCIIFLDGSSTGAAREPEKLYGTIKTKK